MFSTKSSIIGKSTSNPKNSTHANSGTLGSSVLPSIFTVAAAALAGGSNNLNNGNNHSTTATSKDHNNNFKKGRGSSLSSSTLGANEINFRDYSNPIYSDQFNNHNVLTFKLVKTVADFTQQLADIHERNAQELQLLVENFRIKNADLRKERYNYQSDLFNVWELLLQEVEVDSQLYGDIARNFKRYLANGISEKTIHKKIQSRKIFIFQESFFSMLKRADELLEQFYNDYFESYQILLENYTENNLLVYYDKHNIYIQQIHACNSMIKFYQTELLPSLLEELQEVYLEVSNVVVNAICACSEFIITKAKEQDENYQIISQRCKQVNVRQDIQIFLKSLNQNNSINLTTSGLMKLRNFSSPALVIANPQSNIDRRSLILKNEIILANNKILYAKKVETLRQEISNLEAKIQQIEETLETLIKLQQGSLKSSLFNKVNEIQEDISSKRFDLHTAKIHLAALKSQIDLILSSDRGIILDNLIVTNKEKKNSTTAASSIKNKWLKALKSLKTSDTPTSTKLAEIDLKARVALHHQEACSRFQSISQHVFQEYTYKKITPCDVCGQILKGHSRQGLKCKICKINVHAIECQDSASKCQPSKSKILRRQKSSSEIETSRYSQIENYYDKRENQLHNISAPSSSCTSIEPVQLMVRAAAEFRRNINQANKPSFSGERKFYGAVQRVRANNSNLLSVQNNASNVSCSAPHSPQRKKMSLRMKSFSLDESNSTIHSPHSNLSIYPMKRLNEVNTISNQQNFRKQFGKIRMSSVEMYQNSFDKLSGSPSPCPSPIVPKPQRLLPTNIYLVLYNFIAGQEDEINLKAGTTLSVTDTSDPDWWIGKCCGCIGYFPSKYVTKLFCGERPLQITHPIQLNNGDSSIVKLLRDQIVIQIGEEADGLIKIRTGNSDKPITCPVHYTQEI